MLEPRPSPKTYKVWLGNEFSSLSLDVIGTLVCLVGPCVVERVEQLYIVFRPGRGRESEMRNPTAHYYNLREGEGSMLEHDMLEIDRRPALPLQVANCVGGCEVRSTRDSPRHH